MSGCGFPNHLSASVTGGVTVNSVTFVTPTTVTLNISTVGAALKAGYNWHSRKPVEAEQLVALVSTVVGRSA